MRRYFEALRPADPLNAIDAVPDGLFLVRVDRAQYRWRRRKPYYEIRFAILRPKHLSGYSMVGRLSCIPSAMWKLGWFLRDFGYDTELIGRGEIDDKALVDLWGVVKIGHSVVHGMPVLNLESFSPAASWKELPTGADPNGDTSGAPS